MTHRPENGDPVITDFDTFAEDAFYTRFFHWEKTPAFRRMGLTAADLLHLSARMARTDTTRMETLHAHLCSVLEASASDLLEDPKFRGQLARLPFRDDDIVVALGDSITDDGLSWAYLLEAALRQAGRTVRVANHGITGHTTSEAVTRMDLVVAENPTWVLQMLGTNDARRHGHVAMVPAVSLDETERNVKKIAALVSSESDAKLIVITPPPVNDMAAAVWEPFMTAGLTWLDGDVGATSEVILGAAKGPVVNLRATLRTVGTERLLLPDGVHPTIEGQKTLLRAIVAELSAASHTADPRALGAGRY